MSDLDTLVPQGLSSFNSWLSKHNAGPWSFTALTDAQKESLLWIGTTVIFVFVFWRGIPYGFHWIWVGDQDENGKWHLRQKLLLKWIPLLVPFKYLTVLFHEVCHAIVGTATGGRVILIMVDFNQGGATHFSADENHQPSYPATLPAGYTCVFGCIFVVLGFDTLWSKFAFLVFESLAALSLLICLSTIPKSLISHKAHAIRSWLRRLRGHHKEAAEHKKNDEAQEELLKKNAEVSNEHVHPDKKDEIASPKERMASAELIILNNLFIATIVAIAWWLSDSIYLRFIILFIGIMNSLYAIWDIYLDGIKYSTVNSDATLMMREMSERRLDDGKEPRSTTYYSVLWLMAQSLLLIVSIVIALYLHKTTIAEQAVRSRDFLPSPNHYGPADLFTQASDSLSDASQDWQDLFDGSEDAQR